MVKQWIRDEYGRLMNGKTEKDHYDSFTNIIDSGFKILGNFEHKQWDNNAEHDSFILLQMNLVKALSILKIYDGLYYKNSIAKDVNFNGLKDPFSLWALVRAQFENFCTFNNTFIDTTKDEQDLLYKLWVLSGLNYRQRFASYITLEENRQKQLKEQKDILDITNEIKENKLYKGFDPKDQEKVNTAIKKKNFQLTVKKNKVLNVSWQDMIEFAGVDKDAFGAFYNMLSLNTHPSNVSVFQFTTMYSSDFHKSSNNFALKLSKLIIAFMIRDFCYKYKAAEIVFNALPEINQLLINSFNETFRDKTYKLNNIEDFV